MKYISATLLSVVLFISCTNQDEPKPVVNDPLIDPVEGVDAPTNPTVMTTGPFTSFAHSLAGTATLYVDDTGVRTLRFENFNMTAGPDVYVLFSKTNNYSAANTVAISMLKGSYSNSSLNFEVSNSIDLSTHKFVLVYCVQFSSLFGYSELKP